MFTAREREDITRAIERAVHAIDHPNFRSTAPVHFLLTIVGTNGATAVILNPPEAETETDQRDSCA